jgi:hypothetical protein
MKLPKSLLTAIAVGLAVQVTVSSCSKDKTPEPKKEVKITKSPGYPDNCLACGMG